MVEPEHAGRTFRSAPGAPARGGLSDARRSAGEAEDAVQEAWLRLSRAEAGDIENLRRLADDGGRARLPGRAAGAQGAARGGDRGRRARRRRARSCSPTPSCGSRIRSASRCWSCWRRWRRRSGSRSSCTICSTCSFDDIAPIVGRNPAATRQLASRARRRVQGAPGASPSPIARASARVVDAFLAASRAGRLRCAAGDAGSRRRAARRSRWRSRPPRRGPPRGAGPSLAPEVYGARAVAAGLQRAAPGTRGRRWSDGVPGAVWAPGGDRAGGLRVQRSWPAASPRIEIVMDAAHLRDAGGVRCGVMSEQADRSLRDLPGRG